MTHWALKYLGQPWSQERDCWGFFREVQNDRFGLNVPAVEIDSLNLRNVIDTFNTHSERTRWSEVERPVEGDAVLMGRSANPVHVGVWLPVNGGTVLHSEQTSGVVLQSLSSLQIHRWTHIRFYRHVSRYTA